VQKPRGHAAAHQLVFYCAALWRSTIGYGGGTGARPGCRSGISAPLCSCRDRDTRRDRAESGAGRRGANFARLAV